MAQHLCLAAAAAAHHAVTRLTTPRWQRANSLQGSSSVCPSQGSPTGRLLAYDPRTRTTELLANGIFFANGVALSGALGHRLHGPLCLPSWHMQQLSSYVQ